MPLRLVQVNLKARDDAALGRFWADALGWITSGQGGGASCVAPAGFVWTAPDAPVCLDVIAVPDPATVRCRVHLELATTSAAHRTALVARLTALGARQVNSDSQRTVLADPEGNQFCVPAPRDRHRDTGPIAAVVVDCADPRAMARFWGTATNGTVHEVSGERALLRPAGGPGPDIEFQATPHLGDAHHRAHLDVVPVAGTGQAAEVTRLLDLGATPADIGQGEVSWVVLTDPEGNQFCVLAPP
ncbi:VOC family protein [Actinoplanes sp. DH11]|uniref:VOC family protein n=1 Tax=Actinoplanes sp. DH11 TaxID=2857011 RepID=UPI001E489437|nr:VOC family protein [Actinoplanes sp. DH11]